MNNIITSEYGEIYRGYYPYMDWDENPTNRTPISHPYSYDPYVIWKKYNKYNNTVYSDRLVQWDYSKYNRIRKDIFKDESQYWDNCSGKDVELFLRKYFNDDTIVLCGVMKGCNVSSGYPYWIFMFRNKKKT